VTKEEELMTHMNRFNEKWTVDAEGCHIWTRAADKDGYGHFQFEGRPWGAHRWLFMVVHGFVPEYVMHHCDKPACVRLSCLMPGTALDNARDRDRKGRASDRRGGLCPTSKLTIVQVREIRAELQVGVLTQRMLAEVYGVSQPQISAINSGRQWINVAV
jgi:hypothetical protein